MRQSPGFWSALYDIVGFIVFGFYLLLIVSVIIRVIMRRRPIGISLAWLALIVTIPILGVSAYLVLGEIKLGRRRAQLARAMYQPYVLWLKNLVAGFPHQPAQPSAKAVPLVSLVESRLGMPILSGNRIALLSEPQDILHHLINDIQNSCQSCYLEFYIWQSGGTMDEVAEALCEAAQRGVDCRVLLDSIGSAAFFASEWPDQFRDRGVKLVEVLPSKAWRVLLERQDLRMHRKIVIIDDHLAYTGSMNMVDPRYFKQQAGVGEWIDIMMRIEGPSVPVIWSLFARDWEMETRERLLEMQQHEPEIWLDDDVRLQLIPSGPINGGDCIQQVLLQSIYMAERELVFTTPYFVPDDPLVAALRAAADRGVSVKLVIPERIDSRMASYASHAFLEELLLSGVEIYRFRRGLLHTKSVLVDDAIVLIGTVNLDRRSFWLNFEATLLVDDTRFAARLKALQYTYIHAGKRLQLKDWKKRGWEQRVLENVFYLFSPLL